MEKENGGVLVTYKIAMFTKETMRMTESTERECLPGPVETSTKETTWRMRDKEMDRCCGLMAACMKENGSVASSMDWAE